jgi:hypothetical protein
MKSVNALLKARWAFRNTASYPKKAPLAPVLREARSAGTASHHHRGCRSDEWSFPRPARGGGAAGRGGARADRCGHRVCRGRKSPPRSGRRAESCGTRTGAQPAAAW